jgi:drug/metabolite transporter (DMT)-like permease
MSAEDRSAHETAAHEARHRGRVLVALLVVYFAWGTSFVATRLGVQALPPFLFGGVRFLSAGTLMLAYARWQGLRVLPERAEWRDLAVTALFGFLIANGAGVWSM